MGDQRLKFYLDEQMPVVIAEALRRRKIEATTVKELHLRGSFVQRVRILRLSISM